MNGSQVDTYNYVANTHHLDNITGANPQVFDYDAAGNTITRNSFTQLFDDRGRLSHSTQAGSSTAYIYNGLGQRVEKATPSETTHYIYGLNGQLLAEISTTDMSAREYAYLNGQILAAWYIDGQLSVLDPPDASPAGGTFYDGTVVALSSPTTGSAIYFTTDGSTPTSASTLYTAPISLSQTTTIKAIATHAHYADSPVASTTYTIEASPPVITPNGGSYFDSVQVTLSSASPVGSIYYTTDGSTPTSSSTLYSAPFTLTASAVVSAIVIGPGIQTSAVSTASFTVTPKPTAPPPTITVSFTASNHNSAYVYISSSVPGRTIYWKSGSGYPNIKYTGPLYYSTGQSDKTVKIRARVTAPNYNNSGISQKTFTLKGWGGVIPPEISRSQK